MTLPPKTLKLESFLPYRLSIASNMVSDVIASAYRSLFGLTVAEWRVIASLTETGSASQVELGSFTQMDKVTVSRAAIALTNRGLLERRANPEDGRSHLLALSASGRALYTDVAPKALALERELLSGFSKEEVENLTAMLRRLEKAAAAMA